MEAKRTDNTLTGYCLSKDLSEGNRTDVIRKVGEITLTFFKTSGFGSDGLINRMHCLLLGISLLRSVRSFSVPLFTTS